VAKKRIFLLLAGFVIAGFAMVAGGYMIKNNKNKVASGPRVLRVAWPTKAKASEFEPTRIYLAPEYIFLENVFSPLVELYSTDGQTESGVADKFGVEDDDVVFHIRKGLKTVDGYEITAKDVEFSLKRLLVLSGNTHGNFKDLVCKDAVLKSVTDACPGIRVIGDEVRIHAPKGKAFLIPMLAAIDFAVIPIPSVDPKTLAITDYRNTSGPYYVEKDFGGGRMTLKKNPNHYHAGLSSPDVLELIPVDKEGPNTSLQAFDSGQVDAISTVDSIRPDDVIRFSRGREDSNLHLSMNIRCFLLVFTKRGLKEIPKNERYAIGERIRRAFVENFHKDDGFEPAHQFFPGFGEGALNKETLQKIDGHFSGTSQPDVSNLRLSAVRVGDVNTIQKIIKSELPDLKVEEGKNIPDFSKYQSPDEEPQMFINAPDVGFLEDIGLISYSLSAGYFGMNKNERAQWLAEYMAIPDKEHRIEKLVGLHKKILDEAVIVPLVVSPYVALARKPWNIGLSQLFANNPFWRFTWN